MRRHVRLGSLTAVVGLSSLLACAKVPVMRGEIDGLRQLTDQAERNGAKRCAPRELALAQANTRFAETELDKGDHVRAEGHLEVARPNAQAAYDLSPAKYCSERKFVVEAPPTPGDRDGDGIPDNEDNCPDEPMNWDGMWNTKADAPEGKWGCPHDLDTDGDGIPDSKDMCELLPEDKDGYLDEDGCPDIDNDVDGILDERDGPQGTCKNDSEDPDQYEDDDGCPDLDDDKDTVVDVDDQCPLEPGPPGGAKPGCPVKPSLVVVTEKEIKITQQIHFAFDKDIIRPESFPICDAVVDVLKKNPKMTIRVEGHTDDKGPPEYNKRLSQRRADSVRKYLIGHGIEGSRLEAVGYGMERPIVPNTSPVNRALNRRVQFMRTEANK
jgi:outer membrane protein OmpA-like peptidoglycan-associated protein